jgi:predicted nicotinamide N-methyase
LTVKTTFKTVTRTEDLGFAQFSVCCFENMDQAVDDTWKDLAKAGEGQKFDDLCPYFGQVWDSARVLCGWMNDRPREWAGKRVLEIGCGLGLPAMMAARFGAKVRAADFHPAVGWFLEENLRLNGITGVEYQLIDWRVDDGGGVAWDYILAADVLYERTQAKPLAGFLARAAVRGTRVIVVDPGRPYQSEFIDAMETAGFELVDMVGEPPSSGGPKPVTLFELRLARK